MVLEGQSLLEGRTACAHFRGGGPCEDETADRPSNLLDPLLAAQVVGVVRSEVADADRPILPQDHLNAVQDDRAPVPRRRR